MFGEDEFTTDRINEKDLWPEKMWNMASGTNDEVIMRALREGTILVEIQSEDDHDKANYFYVPNKMNMGRQGSEQFRNLLEYGKSEGAEKDPLVFHQRLKIAQQDRKKFAMWALYAKQNFNPHMVVGTNEVISKELTRSLPEV